ncbi:MAG: PspC domain-containing protein [Chitinophagaceae bacterium]
MEKIININMAGRVIAIEDNAYTALKAYLESLNQYFAQEEGHDEILNDIESRVAELMADRIRRGSVSINIEDIESIKNSIGRVEDFAAADEGDAPRTENPSQANTSNPNRSKRFFRDVNDKIAGGVCSGIAAYLHIDPTLVRIVFAILALGGWGAGILLYLILWIFVPAAPLAGYSGRRLFRDAEDKWIGGVASGIAIYFDKETWIFRLIFAAPFLLSLFSGTLGFFTGTSIIFGSLTGSFLLIYLVLWMVLPVARSDYDKMEMRGEKVDLDSIRKNVMNDIKDRAQTFKGEVTESATRLRGEAKSFMSGRGRSFAQEAKEAGGRMASRGGSVIGGIFNALFMFFGITIAFGLFMVLIGYSFGGFSDFFNDFILRTDTQRTLGWATVFLFFGVPLLGLITSMVRRALRIRTGGRIFSLGYGLLWAAGWVCLIVLASDVSREFSNSSKVVDSLPIAQPVGNRLIVTVPGDAIIYSNSLPWLHGNISGWDLRDGVLQSAMVNVVTNVSPDSLYHVFLRRAAMGTNASEASERARHIAYNVRSISDSVLALDNGYSISKNDRYRAQEVVVDIQIPVGKKIRFDETVEEKLNEFHMPVRHYNWNKKNRWNVGWTYDSDDSRPKWESGIDYTMSANGELLDPGGKPASRSYKYDDDGDKASRLVNGKMDSLDRALQEIERQKEALEDANDN